jgi:two-component system, NtrC family, sensor kinase
MFEPFFTTKLGSGGSGLGLNIVQGFVSRTLGGTIRTVSSPGAGCSVIVEFPCTAPSQPAASSHATKPVGEA